MSTNKSGNKLFKCAIVLCNIHVVHYSIKCYQYVNAGIISLHLHGYTMTLSHKYDHLTM